MLTRQLLEITKEFELLSISWSDQKYEQAASAALQRIPVLNSYLSKLEKDDRYRYELVKRMITVKAKKQTELATKRRHRSEGNTDNGARHHTSRPEDDSGSQSPQESFSPNPSANSRFGYEYRTAEHLVPKPYQVGRPSLPLSPQSGHVVGSDISDIYYAQTKRIQLFALSVADWVEFIARVRDLQEAKDAQIRQKDGLIYKLQSKVIELENELDRYRRSDANRNGVESPRRAYRR